MFIEKKHAGDSTVKLYNVAYCKFRDNFNLACSVSGAKRVFVFIQNR